MTFYNSKSGLHSVVINGLSWSRISEIEDWRGLCARWYELAPLASAELIFKLSATPFLELSLLYCVIEYGIVDLSHFSRQWVCTWP